MTTDTIVEAYTADRFDHDWPTQVVPTRVKELKAHLIVRTAMELFDPVRYRCDMAVFVADLNIISAAYSVTPARVANLVRTRAMAMAAQWRRAAENAGTVA